MVSSDSDADVRFEVPSDVPEPVSAREMTPEWYRMLSAFLNEIDTEASVKMCRPFGDAMRLGTLIRAPCDIHLNNTADGIEIVNDELEQYLTAYDVTQPPVEGNSKFKIPEAKLELPIHWETDEEYLTFITPPKNRNIPEFRPFSLLVDAGATPRQLILPVVFDTETVRLEKGSPLAQFWFIGRNRLITEMEPHSYDDFPDIKQSHEELSRLHQRKKDMYRAHYWQPKDFPTYDTVTRDTPTLAENADYSYDDIDNLIVENDERPMYFFAFDQNFGLVPDPVPTQEYIPQHYKNLTAFIDDDEHGEMLQSQITNAMKLGYVIPCASDIHIHHTEDGVSVDTSFDQSPLHEMMADKMRGNPLGHTEPINIHARWMGHSPDGWSNFFIRPQNHFQEHYRSYNGVVEDDKWIDNANAPGLLDAPKGGKLTLDRGTPIIELLPIHRDDFGRTIEVIEIE